MRQTTWKFKKISELFELPFLKLLFKAQKIYHKNFPHNEIECCTLLNIKTGACPEDCGYCSQSAHYKTGLKVEKLFDLERVVSAAKIAKQNGATRFCMGAAWRSPPAKDFIKILPIIKAVKAVGLETCITLGMLTDSQAAELKNAGLDFYNHNLDTSPAYYEKIITTRSYQDRIDTLHRVQAAGLKVCCGGIIGMGESREDRIEFLRQLACLPSPPQSIPINRLIKTTGVPLESAPMIDNLEFIKTVAVARIMFPHAQVRLSAGRISMSQEMQTLAFMAGANSIFIGDVLLTLKNPSVNNDMKLLEKLSLPVKVNANLC